MKNSVLSAESCLEMLDTEITVGSGISYDRGKKLLTFNPLSKEFSLWHNKHCVDSGQEIESILPYYNEL